MKTICFRLIATYQLERLGWSGLKDSYGQSIFVQCNKEGLHKPLAEVKKVWGPTEIVKRFTDGKPTKIFW